MDYSHVKQGKRTIGGKTHFFRSRMEANYCRILEHWKQEEKILMWEFEPMTYKLDVKRGAKSYLPDFHVTDRDGIMEIHETKGLFTTRDKTKMKNFGKQYPDIKVNIIMSSDFKILEKKYKHLIPDWES